MAKPLGRGALSSRRALALLILVGAIASYIGINEVLRAGAVRRQADMTTTTSISM